LEEIQIAPYVTNGEIAYQKYFRYILEMAEELEGTYVECGVKTGRTMGYMSSFMTYAGFKKRKLWGFDSFEGFPEPAPEDNSEHAVKGKHNHPMETTHNYIAGIGHPDFLLIKGFFEDTLPERYYGGPIAILHLDGDLYQSYKDSFCLIDQVVPGGIIMFDEYKSPTQLRAYPGAAKAIDEYFGDKTKDIKKVTLPLAPSWQKHYLIKDF